MYSPTNIENILAVFQGFRMNPLEIDQYEEKGKAVLIEKMMKFVSQNRPIKFSIMGFPMKSTNTRDKVLGDKPDMAEQLTMDNFREFAQLMKQVYPPGIEITIASDGFAFSDVLRVQENVVDLYKEISLDMAKNSPVNILDLRDFYNHNESINSLQAKLLNQHGISDSELELRILMDTDVNILYKGMIRFMEAEVAMWQEYPSRNQLNKTAKLVTREMMLRNEAYSKLVQSELSDHIRLSMHPSINNGTKFSFQLIRSPKAWTSAWHCAILVNTDGTIETIHKKDAIEAGHELVYNNNRAWNFQAMN